MATRFLKLVNSLLNAVLRLLFGDDIFISYSRVDGATYAAGLGNELVARGFACRLDQWGTEPGVDLPASLIRKIKGSAMFVLLGSPGAGTSDNVKKEIVAYLTTRRTIIPIDMSAAIDRAIWKDLIIGLARSPERSVALESGTPSDSVVNRIEKSFTFRRRDQRLRLIATFVGGVVCLLTLIGGAASVQTARETAKAAQATQKADEAIRISDAQKRIASARALSNQAELIASQQPTEGGLATLLAAESARRFESVEAQQALVWGF